MKKLILALFGILTLGLVCGSNVFAESLPDKTFVLSASNINQNYSFCSGNCSGYNYLTISTNFDTNDNIRFSFNDGSTYYLNINPSRISSAVFSLNSFSSLQYVPSAQTNAHLTGDHTITFTLSAQPSGCSGIVPDGSTTITSNGTYDVTSLSSVTVDVPINLPPFVQIIIDAFWQYHVYFAGAVVSLIAIFLVYRLLRGRLR